MKKNGKIELLRFICALLIVMCHFKNGSVKLSV